MLKNINIFIKIINLVFNHLFIFCFKWINKIKKKIRKTRCLKQKVVEKY